AARSDDLGAVVDRATIGKASGVRRAVTTAALGMTQVMAQAQLPRVAIHRGVADLAALEQCQAAAYLVGTVFLPQSSHQFQAHRFGQMGTRTGGMPPLLGLSVRQRAGIAIGAPVTSQLAAGRARMAADRLGNGFLARTCAMQRGEPVASSEEHTSELPAREK